MEEITLKRVPDKSVFWFGRVAFEKCREASTGEELVLCRIHGTDSVVYIAEHALVTVFNLSKKPGRGGAGFSMKTYLILQG